MNGWVGGWVGGWETYLWIEEERCEWVGGWVGERTRGCEE